MSFARPNLCAISPRNWSGAGVERGKCEHGGDTFHTVKTTTKRMSAKKQDPARLAKSKLKKLQRELRKAARSTRRGKALASTLRGPKTNLKSTKNLSPAPSGESRECPAGPSASPEPRERVWARAWSLQRGPGPDARASRAGPGATTQVTTVPRGAPKSPRARS